MTTITDFLFITEARSDPVNITLENYEEVTVGKHVFLHFLAPWCDPPEVCRNLFPDWTQLMRRFQDHETILVAEINCPGEGMALCKRHKVKGFPTLKWGDPHHLQVYKGDRDIDTLTEFATNKLEAPCSPVTLQHCSKERRAKIESFMELDDEALKEKIRATKKFLEDEVPLMKYVLEEKATAEDTPKKLHPEF